MDNTVWLDIARMEDMDFLWYLANDKLVRANSFNTSYIHWEDHKRWFDNILKDDSRNQFIIMFGQERAGQLRLDEASNSRFSVGISIHRSYRGMGIGCEAVEEAQKIVKSMRPNGAIIDAFIKPGNVASIKMFEKSGFVSAPYDYTIMEDGSATIWMTYRIGV